MISVRSSLLWKTMAIFLPVMLLAELVFFAFQTSKNFESRQKDLISQVEAIIAVQSVSLAGPVWEYDTPSLQVAVDEIAALPSIRRIQVFDDFGDLLVEAGQAHEEQPADDMMFEEELLHLDAGEPVLVGRITIEANADRPIEAFFKELKSDAAGLGFVLLALLAAAFISIRSYVTRPLDHLREAIEKSRSGEIVRVDSNSIDELGTVARAFDELQAQRAVAELRFQQMSKVFRDGADPMIIEDLDGIVIEMNREAEKAYGWTREELIGQPIKTIVPESRFDQASELLAMCKRGDDVRNIEGLRVKKDGTIIDVLLTLSMLRDDAGHPESIVSIASDISALKAAEKELKAYQQDLEDKIEERTHELQVKEQNLQTILNSGSVGIGVLDQDTGERIFANATLREMLGADNVDELFETDLALTYVNIMDLEDFMRIVRSGSPVHNMEVLRRRLDGEKIWVLQSIHPIGEFQGRNACVTWLLDITDQKTAEIELAKQKEILDIALDNMDQGITMYDENLNLVMRNDRLLTVMDIPLETVEAGSNIADIFRYNAERGEYGDGDIDEMVNERVELARTAAAHRFQRVLKDGRTIDIKGQPVVTGGFVTTYTDITEIVQVQRDTKLLREAMDTFSDMIILYDKDEKVIFTNDRYHEIYPHAPSKESIRTHSMESLLRRSLDAGLIGAPLAKTDPEAWLQQALESRRQPEGGSGETNHSSGRTFFFRYARTTEGGLILMQTDITERKLMEDAIRQGAETLQTTIDNNPAGIIMCDAEARISIFNSQFSEMLDFPDDLISEGALLTDIWRFQYERGDYGFDLSIDEQLEQLHQIFRRREIQTYQRRLDSGRVLDMRFSSLPDGGGVWVASDATEREKMMQALRENEEQLRGILENSPIAVAISRDDSTEEDGVIDFSNARFRSILRIDENEMGRVRTTDFFDPGADRTMHEDMLDEGQSLFDIEAPWKTRDGSDVWTLMSLSPIQYEDRKAALVWLYDISELKRIQQEVIEKEKQLRMAMENMPGAMQVVDDDLNIVMVNDKYVEFYGDPDGLLMQGTPMEAVLRSEMARGLLKGQGEEDEIIQERLASYRQETSSTFEDLTSDGRFVQLTRNPAPDGHTVSVGVDITERKQAEKLIADAMALINESIQYASRIQLAMLPNPESLKRIFSDHMMIWRPKEGVGGDIVLLRESGPGPLLCVIDCTGHGVPGGFMTVVVASAFDRALTENKNAPPAALLRRVNQLVKSVLGQDRQDGDSDDGFECAICQLDRSLNELVFAGARFELWEFEPSGDLVVHAGDKTGVGYRSTPTHLVVQEHHIPMDKNSRFFVSSDGMIDQVGGPRGRSLGKRRLKEMLEQHGDLKLSELHEPLLQKFDEYRGDQEQRDDLSLVGFELQPFS